LRIGSKRTAAPDESSRPLLEYLEFESLGTNLYGRTYESDTVTNEQLMNYLLNEHSIVQVDSFIMKPVDNNDFLLTVTESRLNGLTFEHLTEWLL
jgi:hypothetical protein